MAGEGAMTRGGRRDPPLEAAPQLMRGPPLSTRSRVGRSLGSANARLRPAPVRSGRSMKPPIHRAARAQL